MVISFENPKYEALLADEDALSRRFDKKGQDNAEEIRATIAVLRAANTLFDIPPAYRPHPLQGKYKGCFAVDVTKTHRIIFFPDHESDPDFQIYNFRSIKRIVVTELFKDYH